MSVGKFINFTRSLARFPQSITSLFNLSGNNGENIAKNSNLTQRNFSFDAENTENLLPSLKSYSKRVRFYDRSEAEKETTEE